MNSQVFHELRAQPIWEVEETILFNELIVSWNIRVPLSSFHFYLSVKLKEWSPWIPYAVWGKGCQKTFNISISNILCYQDTLKILEGKASGFRVKIDTADISSLSALHACVSDTQSLRTIECNEKGSPIHIPLQGLSQMSLTHPQRTSICSPTATSAVLRYLSKKSIDPVDFAESVLDHGFNIYGNWIFNVARAYEYLPENTYVWVDRIHSFHRVYQLLIKGYPLVISVRSPLSGSAIEYSNGHLMVICGCDLQQQKIICMDPAFPRDSDTLVSYSLPDLMKAWQRRHYTAYIFSKSL